MFIYNVTSKIDWSIHDGWIEWMLEEHMPAMVATRCFTQAQLLKLHEQDDTDGPTYAAQYFAESKAQYNRYLEMHAQRFRQDSAKKWGDKFIAFRTLMEVIPT